MLPEMVAPTTEWREPTSCDRLPVHRSESPTGYSSAGCSPAEPASASPVTDHRSSIPKRCLATIRCRAGRVRRQRGCHLYFARRVTFLSCGDMMPLTGTGFAARPETRLTSCVHTHHHFMHGLCVGDREARADCQCGELIDRIAAGSPVS